MSPVIPVELTCKCGNIILGNLGDVLTCICGRRYIYKIRSGKYIYAGKKR